MPRNEYQAGEERRRQAAWNAITLGNRKAKLTVEDYRLGAELFNRGRTAPAAVIEDHFIEFTDDTDGQ